MFRIFMYMYTNYSLLFTLLVVGSKVDLWRQNLKKTFFDSRRIHSQQQKCNYGISYYWEGFLHIILQIDIPFVSNWQVEKFLYFTCVHKV